MSSIPSLFSPGTGVKHLNPRQGITTTVASSYRPQSTPITCETPKSPPGDYNSLSSSATSAPNWCWCETPKSPPGDYNRSASWTHCKPRAAASVKHLNPRQGSTTCAERHRRCARRRLVAGVKHLNPRQGITSLPLGVQNHPEARCCVKHLNPRQGITTRNERA